MSWGASCPGATAVTSRQDPSLPGSRYGYGTLAVCSLAPFRPPRLRRNSPPPSRSEHSQSELGPWGRTEQACAACRACGCLDPQGPPHGTKTSLRTIMSRESTTPVHCFQENHIHRLFFKVAPLDKTLRHSCLPVCDWP